MFILSVVVTLLYVCCSHAFLLSEQVFSAKRFVPRRLAPCLRPIRNLITRPATPDNNQLTYTEVLANDWEEDDTDYESLDPDDPRFAKMAIPTENGPLANAYARHMLWRQKLGENECKLCGFCFVTFCT